MSCAHGCQPSLPFRKEAVKKPTIGHGFQRMERVSFALSVYCLLISLFRRVLRARRGRGASFS
jgi:hypothetical protein